jgi:hypothetical protein
MKGRTSLYQSALTFFGLTSTYRLNLFAQIHEIVFHGKGGYDWNTIYEMPIWLRHFTFKKIKEWYDKEQEQADAQTNQLTNKSDPKQLARPNIPQANTYDTKVPTKK